MKKSLNLYLAALMLAAFCLPVFAQEDTTEHAQGSLSSDNPDGQTASGGAPAAKKGQAKKAASEAKSTAAKKAKAGAAAKKKKAKKKKPAPPVSEYKFSSGESAPTYKFDKKANPIVKAPKKKKGAKKAAGKAAGKAAKGAPAANAKLKTSKPIGAEDQPAQGAGGQADQPAAE